MSVNSSFASLGNGLSIRLKDVPELSLGDFAAGLIDGVKAGKRVSSLFGSQAEGRDGTVLYAILADDARNSLEVASAVVKGDGFESMTPACPQVHLFEREIAEQYGLRPEGHPWLKPARWQRSRTGRDAWQRPSGEALLPAVGDFYRVEGEEVHEVAVGPVHAGVIEPGHFRFQCHGERVFHLEIALGYQHRGVEESLRGGPHRHTAARIETLAGDTTVGHATAWAQALEALSATTAPPRAQAIRGIALELERLANHAGDLGALAGDVGFLPTASFCGRLRGDFLNMTALLAGNRFGRGLVRPGGTLVDLDAPLAGELLRRLDDPGSLLLCGLVLAVVGLAVGPSGAFAQTGGNNGNGGNNPNTPPTATVHPPLPAIATSDSNGQMIAVTGIDLTGSSVLYLVDTQNRQLAIYQANGGSDSTQGVKLIGARRIDLDLKLYGFNDKSEYSFEELEKRFGAAKGGAANPVR